VGYPLLVTHVYVHSAEGLENQDNPGGKESFLSQCTTCSISVVPKLRVREWSEVEWTPRMQMGRQEDCRIIIRIRTRNQTADYCLCFLQTRNVLLCSWYFCANGMVLVSTFLVCMVLVSMVLVCMVLVSKVLVSMVLVSKVLVSRVLICMVPGQ